MPSQMKGYTSTPNINISKPEPGSSLPSGQSHESSLTKSHGISLEPSKHFHAPAVEGLYFSRKSGATPSVLATGTVAVAARGRLRRRAQAIIELGVQRPFDVFSKGVLCNAPNKARLSS